MSKILDRLKAYETMEDWPGDARVVEDIAAATKHVEMLERALTGLMTSRHINLGDLVYTVREREGLGWEGPSVVAWSAAVGAAEGAMKAIK